MSPRTVRWLLLALVVGSLLLRLGFAGYGLGPQRFYDERYSLENLRALLAPAAGGSQPADPSRADPPSDRLLQRLRPANGWYPSLSYLPQAPLLAACNALYRATGIERLAIFQRDGFTPTAYWLCRATIALFGALTLVAAFLVGRRLFEQTSGTGGGALIGLLAVLLLAASPTHLRQSAMFKPDMLLTLLTLAVFLLTLRLAEQRDSVTAEVKAGILAGLVVGLATASKLNGVLTALLPLSVLGFRAIRERSWRPLAALATAGLTAGATFLALNPFPGLHAEYLDRNLRIYGERAELAGLDRVSAFETTVEHLLSPGFHGPALGLVALAGLIGLGIAAWRGWRSHPGLAGLVPLWVVGYVVVYTGTAAYPKANNLLLVLPFTALAAAWLLVLAGRTVWAGATRRWPELERAGVRRTVGVAVALALGIGLLAPLHVYAYRTAVPTTRDLVERALADALRPFAGRTVLFQTGRSDGVSPPVLLTRRAAVAVQEVPDLGALPPETRRLADAEVFPAEDWEGEKQPRTRHIDPELGRAWGPRWAVRIHPWEPVSHQRHWAETASPGTWLLPLPEKPGEDEDLGDLWISVQILIRDPEPPPVPPRVEVAGREVALHATRVETGGYVYGTAYTSSRFPRSPEIEIRAVFPTLPASEPAQRPPVADVLVWREPVQ